MKTPAIQCDNCIVYLIQRHSEGSGK